MVKAIKPKTYETYQCDRSLATPQVVQTHIWFKDQPAGRQLVEYELERPTYEALLKQFGNDKEAVIKYYAGKVIDTVGKGLAKIRGSEICSTNQ